MKKHLLLVAALAAGMAVNAQYTQELPLDYNDFFRADAIAEDGNHLERGEYTTTDQYGSSHPDGAQIMADQWNLTGKTSDQKGDNPTVKASTLKYDNYIDNEAGKEIMLANLPLDADNTQTRASIYSMKKDYTYGGQAYYLAFLVKITEATGEGDILSFDGNFTANAQRGRLFVNKQGSGFKLGLGWSSKPAAANYSGELSISSTHLVVMKVIPAGNTSEGTEAVALWIDPDLSKTEAENAPLVNLTEQTIGLKSVRGITIRQRSKIAGSIAGLRFSDNWADVVKADPDDPTAIDEVNAGVKARKVIKDGQMLIERNGELYNMTGAKVL